MHCEYTPKGVCSHTIRFDLTDGRITGLEFQGGCHGNTQGLSRLVEGMDAREAAGRLRGIRCGRKQTSCPDQLAKALDEALSEQS